MSNTPLKVTLVLVSGFAFTGWGPLAFAASSTDQSSPAASSPAADTAAREKPAADGHAQDKDAPKSEAGTYGQKETYPHSASDVSTTALISGGSAQSGGAPIAAAASVVESRIKEWKLSGAEVQAEIDAGKPIERTKSAGVGEPTGKTDDAALETLINNRLLADSDTVRVTARVKADHGEVTLGGVAATSELIGRTIAIVLDTQGVTKVTADLEIDPMQPGAPKDDAARIELNAAKQK